MVLFVYGFCFWRFQEAFQELNRNIHSAMVKEFFPKGIGSQFIQFLLLLNTDHIFKLRYNINLAVPFNYGMFKYPSGL